MEQYRGRFLEEVSEIKISLFGCGYCAERLYYEISAKGLADVIYVFDNFAGGA